MAVEPVVAPPPGNPRFPLVDSLRGLACLAVITTHAVRISGADRAQWFGRYSEHLLWAATVFFVISAFLLYRPFVAARLNRTDTAPAIADYAWRRTLRVLPGFWVAMTVTWILFDPAKMGHWLTYYSLTQVYGQQGLWLGGNPPTWTLACEIVFYVLLPAFVVLMGRWNARGTRRERFRTELALVWVLFMVGVGFHLVAPRLAQGSLSRTFLSTVDWFAIGMALAVVSAYVAGLERQPGWVRTVARRPGACWLVGLALFAVNSLAFPDAVDFFGARTAHPAIQDFASHLVYGLTALAFMLPAVFGHTAGGLVRRLLGTRTLRWLGLVAYGVYLYHWAILEQLWKGAGRAEDGSHWLSLLLGTMALSIAAGAASYYAVERPILRFKDVRLRRRVAQARLSET
jgi:peptidoglycan/LPS O-acetylase OafA/YrhL